MPSAISAWAGAPWRRSVEAPLGRISEVVTPISGRICARYAPIGAAQTWPIGQIVRRAARRSGDLSSSGDVEPIHLHHVQAEPDASAGQAGAEGHLAQLHAGSEDRR